MHVTAVLPRFYDTVKYVPETVGSFVRVCRPDYRRTYLRIVFGTAGIGLNAALLIDGTDDTSIYHLPTASTVFEMKWIDVQVLVQGEIWLRDIAAASVVSAWGVISIEDTIRKPIHDPRNAKSMLTRSKGTRWRASIKPRRYKYLHSGKSA